MGGGPPLSHIVCGGGITPTRKETMKLKAEYMPIATHTGDDIYCWVVVLTDGSERIHVVKDRAHKHYPGPLMPDLEAVIKATANWNPCRPFWPKWK